MPPIIIDSNESAIIFSAETPKVPSIATKVTSLTPKPDGEIGSILNSVVIGNSSMK